MLKGTVYTVVDGVPSKPQVREVGFGSGQQSVDNFKATVVRELGLKMTEVEFGPIGEPWRKP